MKKRLNTWVIEIETISNDADKVSEEWISEQLQNMIDNFSKNIVGNSIGLVKVKEFEISLEESFTTTVKEDN